MNQDPGATRSEAYRIFEELLEADAATRQRVLQQLGVSKPQVHARVLSLLEADRRAGAGDFMQDNALQRLREAEWPSDLDAGAHIGPYRLERPLGSGGMGEVWLAQRLDGVSEAPVALKLLHAHLAQSALRERFLREGRILGQLSHPNIARLLDAGIAPDGRLYLAIEYVDGARIDAWCDTQRLNLDARLRLFLQACDAVAHAHAHLVVHRDLKPSNILVGGDGTIKLLDFGIARLIEGESEPEAQTELTRLGGRVLTPEYAAPEQVAGGAISTATDVYALGVLLYQLLCGHRPYGAPGATPDQIEREVLDTEPRPPSQVRPSRRPETNAETIALLRTTTPRKLRDALRGDLDTIVGKALKKLPQQRYATVPAFADDLRRYLAHLPVLARPDSLAYRLHKYLRRHRLGVAASAAIAAALIAGIAGVLWQASVARRQAHLAEVEAATAKATADFMLGIFERNSVNSPDPAKARATTAEQLLASAAQNIHEAFKDQPEVRLQLLENMQRLYSEMSLPEQSIDLLREGLKTEREIHGSGPNAEVAGALIALGSDYGGLGRYAEAEPPLSEAVAMLDTLGDHSSELRAGALLWLGEIAYHTRPAYDDTAQRHYAEALRIVEQNHLSDHLRVILINGLAKAASNRGDYAAAEPLLRQALSLGKDRMSLANTHQFLGETLLNLRRYPEAETELKQAAQGFEEAGGADHPKAAYARVMTGHLLAATGRRAEAEPLIAAALASLEHRLGGAESAFVPRSREELATLHYQRGDLAAAAALFQACVPVFGKTAPTGLQYGDALGRYGLVQAAQGRWSEAEQSLGQSREVLLATRGEASPGYGLALEREGELWLLRGETARAAERFGQVTQRWPATAQDLPPSYLPAELGLAQAQLDQNDAAAALAIADAVLKRVQAQAVPASLSDEEAAAHRLRGQALLRQGQLVEAEAELRRAVQMREALDVPDSLWLAQDRIALAQDLVADHHKAEARRLLASAAAAQTTAASLAEPYRKALVQARAAAGA